MPAFHAFREIPRSARAHPWLALVLLGTLGLLLWHGWTYRFLTDDAYISFRYAVNFAEGHGLVFNPGEERVEGYTNFLWVLLLAAAHRLGIPPETAAPVLTFALTILLWAAVLWFLLRVMKAPEPRWLTPLPLLMLAATRSVAVWSTSGLETRLFEVLVVGGTLRLLAELQDHRLGAHRPFPLAALLFALGALTRPDGILLAGAAFGSAGLILAMERRRTFWRIAAQAAGMGAVIGAHFLFRIAYYGQWLPNTYYAKVGGRTWLGMGLNYLGTFFLEYGALLWVPLMIAAVLWFRRRGALAVPLVFAAVVLPHMAYIALIGGDHFEFRPLDLYFPFLFILLYAGTLHWAQSRRGRRLAPIYAAAVLAGLAWLPWQGHRQFPMDQYIVAFPGEHEPPEDTSVFWLPPRLHNASPMYNLVQFPVLQTRMEAAKRHLDPGRDAVLGRWALRPIAEAYQGLVRKTTMHFVGIRQEEHRLFLEAVAPEGRLMGRLSSEGVFPPDAYIAVSSVGAIPYYSRLRTLDRLGLNDALVARAGLRVEGRAMAHERHATLEYARERGVDFWAVDSVHLVMSAEDPQFFWRVQDALMREIPAHVAEMGKGRFLFALLPQGEERTRERFPGMILSRFWEPAALEVLNRKVIAYLESASEASDADTVYLLGQWKLFAGDPAGALGVWESLSAVYWDRIPHWLNLAAARSDIGDRNGALGAARRALELSRAWGDERLTAEIAAHIRTLEAAVFAPAQPPSPGP